MIEKEFVKDEGNSIDKRKLQADRFGYKSLHVVVSLNDSRTDLKEYKRYKNLKCEIQIRSILQHAWAEIEHDLGYKGEISIPDEYKRSFNRISALLETADIDFNRLKSELITYEKEVPELIINNPDDVDVNKASIISCINTNTILAEVKEIIETHISGKLIDTEFYDNIIQGMNFFKIDSIGLLEKLLIENRKSFLVFAKLFVEERLSAGREVVFTAPLMFFLHYLSGKTEDSKTIQDYLITCAYSINDNEYYIRLYLKSLSQYTI